MVAGTRPDNRRTLLAVAHQARGGGVALMHWPPWGIARYSIDEYVVETLAFAGREANLVAASPAAWIARKSGVGLKTQRMLEFAALSGSAVDIAEGRSSGRGCMMNQRVWCTVLVAIAVLPSVSRCEEYTVHDFERVELSDTYFSEGANAGDFNKDGHSDVVYGPYWFEGPEFSVKHAIYEPKPQNRERYADNFFSWCRDFSGDGLDDVFVVGFPGTAAYVYVNPGSKSDQHWEKREVIDWVSNESPQFVSIVGDDQPELVCTREGRFGYATIDWSAPLKPWKFHVISDQNAPRQFGHGLGVGDIDGDERADILTKDGWFAQPEDLEDGTTWTFHPFSFAPRGGADMFAYDVDGDGDNDVITSLEAHEYGLAWFEQVEDGGKLSFVKHTIMGRTPEENEFGVLFTELHSVALADMDGDGLKDIVTGKTYWSHHRQSPLWDAGAVVYWFKLTRGKDGVRWIPYKADSDAGIGRQVIVTDINRDEVPDIVVGGMKGANVLRHRVRTVSKEEWEQAQPQEFRPLKAGLPPSEAAAYMTAPQGFKVQLAAGEPDVHQPIAMAFDARGRLWIAEAYTYPQRAPEGQGRDKIIILEDTDGDGTLDKRKVFAEGLNLVSGLEVGFGGVWIGAAPYLMFIPDRNHDDQPDGEPEILLDGFGYQDTHETLNAFIWGPDGWLYGCHGVFTHSLVGKPGTPEAERVPFNAGVWRYHPVRHKFEAFARGTSNPWGVDFNDHGHAFITACVIPHLWHMIQGGRYQRQGGRHFNPYIYEDIQTIARHRHYVGNIRDHAWWGSEPKTPQSTLAAGGGHAHAGAMIYLGDNWPEQYRGQLFMNNIHGNRVNNDVLLRSGSGYAGDRAPDIILANDRWYRGINLRYGPDGSVYMIDWYDPNACHRTNPDVWDRTNGRIYRVAYGEPDWKTVDLRSSSNAELVELQMHANDWYVRMARKILQERAAAGQAGADEVEQLWAQFQNQDDVPRKLRSLWAMHVVGGLTESNLSELLDHSSEYIRSWAIQLAHDGMDVSEPLVHRWEALAKSDPSPLVRLYLSSAAQRIDVNRRWKLVENLLTHDEDSGDHNLPLMYWFAVEPLVAADAGRAMEVLANVKIPEVRSFMIRRAAVEKDGLVKVVEQLVSNDDPGDQKMVLGEMLASYEGRVNVQMPESWTPAYEKLIQSSDAEIRDQADRLAVIFGDKRIFPRLRKVLVDSDETIAKRQQALQILVRGRDAEAVQPLQQVVSEQPLRGPAIRALAGYDDTRTPNVILSVYANLGEAERRDAVNTLVSRPQYARELLAAMEGGKVARTDLHAFNVRQLLRFNDAALTRKLKDVWGEIRESSGDKQKQIAEWKSKLSTDALKSSDVGNGRRMFAKTCSNCHMLFGTGGKIGPDITGSNRANLDYILENIVDPSAVMGKDYRVTTVVTDNGRVISGMLKDENDNAITLQTINDRIVIAKSEIDERQLSTTSMMPERLLDAMKPEEVRDLVAYLSSSTQVAWRGPRAPINASTGAVDGALEGESMKIVGKSGGKTASQAMGGFKSDRWSGNKHLWWTGAKPGGYLEVEIPVPADGLYDVEIVLTRARDYGVIRMVLAGQPLGGPVDLYDPNVVTTGVLDFDGLKLKKGPQRLRLEIVGTNSKAKKSYMSGLDYIRLTQSAEK